jgi:hypothetical protein
MQQRADCLPLCGLGNSPIAPSGRPLRFFRDRNRRLKQFHSHRTAQRRLSRCKSHGSCATETMLPAPLLNRLPLSHLRRLQDQEDRVVQGGREARLRLSRPEIQAHPSDQAVLRRKPPIRSPR